MVLRHDAAQIVTLRDALQRGTIALRVAGDDEAALDAELLLRHVLGLDKTCFYLQLQDALSDEQAHEYEALLAQRRSHRPTAYLTGHREFYGLDLHVESGVLIPRPESEMLVDESLRELRARLERQRRAVFVDAGTGSGAIAIAVAKSLPQADVYATEISPAALAIAQYNARRLRVAGRVRFLQGDLLDPLREPADVIAANLPYVATQEIATLAPEVRDNEPRLALDGGDDGLEVIRRFLRQLPAHAAPDAVAILEIGDEQAAAVTALAAEVARGSVRVLPDLAGLDRVVAVSL
jgi:release factor glutamine methyltransferase